jgi:hypothetical protein
MASFVSAITLLIVGEALQRYLFELKADFLSRGFVSFGSESSVDIENRADFGLTHTLV